MRRAFEHNGIPSPHFKKVSKGEDIDGLGLAYPLIVKPTDRSGSREVEKVTDSGSLSHALNRAFEESFENEAIVEEYIEG